MNGWEKAAAFPALISDVFLPFASLVLGNLMQGMFWKEKSTCKLGLGLGLACFPGGSRRPLGGSLALWVFWLVFFFFS